MLQREDVDVLLGQRRGDVAQQPGPVEGLHLDATPRTCRRVVLVPLDLDEAVALAAGSDTALAQSARCTDTPRPRVTKPMISSPGTGVQQRDSRTITSSRPSTCTPDAAAWSCRGWRGARTVVGSCSSRSGSPSAQRLADPGRHRLGRHVVLADRGVAARRGRRSSASAATSSSSVGRQLLDRQALAAQRLDQLVAAGLDGVLAPLAGEPLADLVRGPRRADDLQPVPLRAGALDLRREDLDGVARRRAGGRAARAGR